MLPDSKIRTETKMTTEHNTQDFAALNEEVKAIWNQNAEFWDGKMGDGNDFQRILVGPSTERLLNLQPGEQVLEIGCGNGVFARRMAQLGVHVLATDFSEEFIERARARTTNHIEYRIVDATKEEELLALGTRRFDAATCNMALMDMAEIDPLMRAMSQVIKVGGRFVFSLMHPCFNTMGVTMTLEEEDKEGELILTRAVKVSKYLGTGVQKGLGIIGQPAPQYYFLRPLHVILNACFKAGLVMDGIEEPAFNHPHDGSNSSRPLSWTYYTEIPPVLAVRMRIQ